MHGRDSKKYLILGAGISGLSLAWFLKKQDPTSEITILEKTSKVGGPIQTHHTFGFLFEQGPHMLRLTPPYAEVCDELFEDLNLTEQIIAPSKAFQKRYYADQNKLIPLSVSPLELLHPKNFIKLTYPILKNTLKAPKSTNEDCSIRDFFENNFGSYITDHMVDSFVSGINGGDIGSLSFEACFPSLHKLSKSPKPIIRELIKAKKKYKARMISFKDGLATLTHTLAKELQDHIEFNVDITGISYRDQPTVMSSNGEYKADHIFSTLPSHALSKVLSSYKLNSQPFLENQKHHSYKIVHVGYDAKLDLMDAFGFVSPSWSSQNISGVIFDSKIFSEHNFHSRQTRLTAMICETSPLYDCSDEHFKEAFFKELNQILNIHIEPQYYEVSELKKTVTQYHVGHHACVKNFEKEIEEKLPYLSVIGHSFYGLSVPMCIYSAKQCAAKSSLVHN